MYNVEKPIEDTREPRTLRSRNFSTTLEEFLKLMRTPLYVLLRGFWNCLPLSTHLLPRMNVMLDFIWTLPVQLRGTRNKWTLKKNLVHGRIRTTNTARPPDYRIQDQLKLYSINKSSMTNERQKLRQPFRELTYGQAVYVLVIKMNMNVTTTVFKVLHPSGLKCQ